MVRNRRVSNIEHPLAFGSFRSWLRLLRASNGVGKRFLPRVLFVSLSTLLTAPLRAYERARYGGIIEGTAVHPSPVFIVGHWRTGTTHLHNLLCQDPNLGYLSTFQAFAPGLCILGEGTIKRPLGWIARRRHPTREIDNIPLSFDAPEEQELAVANLTSCSVLHWYTFPNRATHFFERYALFQGLSEQDRKEWTDTYLNIMRKITLIRGGRRLVVKNCTDTGRLKALLELFPEARFIHLVRSPYHVFRSTLFLYRTVLPRAQVQDIRAEQVEEYVLRFYRLLMEKFLSERDSVPAGGLVEVRFEDLEASPLDQLRRIYDELDLPGFEEAEPAFRRYIASIAGYRKNPQSVSRQAIDQVNRHWRFALEEWGYGPP